eukprot:m.195799 g.195799  ORF g.195799 m.195799 type:complete len:105 (+) comp39520_c0_seq1:374-688(+)
MVMLSLAFPQRSSPSSHEQFATSRPKGVEVNFAMFFRHFSVQCAEREGNKASAQLCTDAVIRAMQDELEKQRACAMMQFDEGGGGPPKQAAAKWVFSRRQTASV